MKVGGLMKHKILISKICIAGLCLALGLALPFITGQMKEIGNMLCPMHIPVIICGFICGPIYGLVIGFITPLLRSLLFSMPPLYPIASAMAIELAVYGLVSGLLYSILNKKGKVNNLGMNIAYIYISLIVAMLVGRLCWGLTRYIFTLIDATMEFSFQTFLAGAFVNAWPGIIIQLVIIPLLIATLIKVKVIPLEKRG